MVGGGGGGALKCGSGAEAAAAAADVADGSQLKVLLGRPRPCVALGSGTVTVTGSDVGVVVAASPAGVAASALPALLDCAPTILETVMLYMKDMGSKCSHLVLKRSLCRIWRCTKLW